MNETTYSDIDGGKPWVQVKNVSVQLGFRHVLRDISFDLFAGRILTILGPNAAGKTTLLRTLAGAIAPDQGHIYYNTRDFAPSTIGWVGHQSFLYDELTVKENLRFWADLQNVKNPARRVEELLDQMGLRLFADERIDILSFGMARRVSICRAILSNPGILLLDEAFSGLDQTGVGFLLKLIHTYKNSNAAVVLTCHQVPLGLSVATDLMVLYKGKSILSGPVDRFDLQAIGKDYLSYAQSQAGGK